MAKTKISEFSATPANNTDIDSINISEGCAPSGINDAIRELMAQLKDFQTGAVGDSFNGPIGTSTAAAGAFTTLSASGTATLSGLTASTALALDASKNIVSVTNTGTGSNVLATSPTLVTPALGTPSSGVVTNLTGTASININGTVGATTASTGAFTTLSASSTVTLSGGTANGVAYLNGSKVVTSGSALTFNGTNLQIGGGATGAIATINGDASGGSLRGQRSGANQWFIGDTASALGSGTGFINYVYNNDPFIWYNGGTSAEQMRLTSTGLGIGTSSPSYKLDVNGGAQLASGSIGGLLNFNYGASASSRQWRLYNDVLANGDFAISQSTTKTGTTFDAKMYFDASGNVGIGTSSPAYKLDVSSSAEIVSRFARSGGSNALVMISDPTSVNAPYIGSYGNALAFGSFGVTEYGRFTSTGLGIGTSSPDFKLVVAGNTDTRIRVDGSTSAGIYFTQGGSNAGTIRGTTSGLQLYVPSTGLAATLDSSGNLGLGVTPSAWGGGYVALQIATRTSLVAGGSANPVLSYNGRFDGTNWLYQASNFASQYQQISGQHQWYTAASGTAGNAITFTQAMTLDASGNLMVGTTTQYSAAGGGTTQGTFEKAQANRTNLVVTNQTNNSSAGAALVLAAYGADWILESGSSTKSSNSLTFTYGTSERARIDSSGNLLVGTTTAQTGVVGDAVGITLYGSSANGVGVFVRNSSLPVLYINNKTSGGALIQFYNGGNIVGDITSNGTTTSYNTSSDYRLKNTIAPMTGALAKVALLKPCTYKWNADGSDGEGFIAHELQAVIPDAVVGEKDAVDENGNIKPQGIDTSFLVATLTAALQEAVAKINSLEARLDAANL